MRPARMSSSASSTVANGGLRSVIKFHPRQIARLRSSNSEYNIERPLDDRRPAHVAALLQVVIPTKGAPQPDEDLSRLLLQIEMFIGGSGGTAFRGAAKSQQKPNREGTQESDGRKADSQAHYLVRNLCNSSSISSNAMLVLLISAADQFSGSAQYPPFK